MVKLNWALSPLILICLAQAATAKSIPRQYKNETTPQKQPVKLTGLSPKLPVHKDTSKYCSYWYDNDGSLACQDILEPFLITLEQLLRWNPGLGPGCSNFLTGWSYCVEAMDEPVITNAPSKTTPGGSSPTKGIQTPTPTQPDMVNNCDAFAFVESGMSCNSLLSKNGITLKQLVAWNPSVKDDCSGLWSNVWVCVSIAGHDANGSTTLKPTTTTTTKTSPTNGVETPSPTQPDMVENCNKFAFVQQGQNCDALAKANGITFADIYKWNPSVKSDCTGLWANVWVCVSVIGNTPSPTKPSPTNGIETPSPIQEGMVKNCNKFHLVKTTTTCSSIENYYKLPLDKFLEWNPDVGKNCQFLLAQYWVCVMTDDYKPSPSPTSPSNGIKTPSPVQENVHKNCNKFHQVQKTTTCSSINNYYNLPLKDFYSWNPSVGTNCQSLLVGYWVCVSIIGWTPPTPSPTTPSNGIKTPSPIQAGMVTNCNKFAEVKSTTTCASIQNYYKISMEQIAKWNPKVGSSCNALLVGYHVCVGVIGQTPTQPPKQDPTPTPFLPDMIKNCKKFHLVKATTTCESIQNYYKITMAQIAKWNPKVGTKCTGLWKDYWVCVGV
jgi:LysM repeat protein